MRRLLLTVTALLVALPATASLGPPVKISREGERSFAQAGREYRGSFLVETKAAVAIELIELEGDGWTGVFLSASPVLNMARDDAQSVEFGGTPAEEAGDLFLVYSVDGEVLRKSLDPRPRRSSRLVEPRAEVTPRDKVSEAKAQSEPTEALAPMPLPGRQVFVTLVLGV